MLASAVTFWRWLSGQPMSLSTMTVLNDPHAERRVWLRFAANLNVRCEPVGEQAESGVYAVIGNLSRGGIQIIASRRFEPGSILSVELPASNGQPALAALACVVRAQPHGESDWAMGCRFASELNDEQLQMFGAARERPPATDPRAWSRFSCDARAVYHRVNRENPSPKTAQVLNIAAAGMALLVDEQIQTGELLSTELHDTEGRPVVTILACVVRVQSVSEGQILGCNFIRELDEKDLRALLGERGT
jgi:hypothetical protein